jgi:hypothetical protein
MPAVVHPRAKSSQPLQPTRQGVTNGKPKDVFCDVLAPEEYVLWDALVDSSPHGTVFHYSWWLSAVAEHFEILAVVDGNRRILGGIPLPRFRRHGLDFIYCPPLAPYLGPIFDISGSTSVCDVLYLTRTWGELLARGIASFDSFHCLAGATAPDLQGFLWAGFRVDLAYTFRFPRGFSPECLMKGMTHIHTQKLLRAERLGTVINNHANIEDLIVLNEKAFPQQNAECGYSAELLRRLCSVADARGKTHIYVAQTRDGVPAAALLTVADSRMTYQILSGINWDARDSEAEFLILWQAIKDALMAGRGFDFEGSTLRDVEVHCRRWGSNAVPVWRIQKTGTWRGAILQSLRCRHAARGHTTASSLS